MIQRAVRRFAWSLVGLYLMLVTIGLGFRFLLPNAPIGFDFSVAVSLSLALTVSSLIGAAIASRLPRNPIGWIIAVLSIIWALEVFSEGYVYYGLVAYLGSLPGAEVILFWEISKASRFGITGVTLLFLWFPDGRLVSLPWRKIAWISVCATFLYVLLATLKPGRVAGYDTLVNPIRIGEGAWAILGPIMTIAGMLVALCLGAAAISLLLRLRRSSGDERQQLKWFVYAAAFFPFSFVFEVYGGPVISTLGVALQVLSLTAMPIALAIAIFKYRLYDIDIIIKRTLVYGLLTAVLALLYFASVALLQGALTSVGGQQSALAIVISTLAVAALFAPLRTRIQDFIDRRFYREKYDADLILATFAQTARDEVDLDSLTARLLYVVEGTMQPEVLSIWLKEPDGMEGQSTMWGSYERN